MEQTQTTILCRPVVISEMGPWDFWASPFGVGLPADVALAIQNGTATEEQQSRAKQATVEARQALIGATFNAPQDDELELPRRIS